MGLACLQLSNLKVVNPSRGVLMFLFETYAISTTSIWPTTVDTTARENSKTAVKDSLNGRETPWSVGTQICIGFQTQRNRVPRLHCTVSSNVDGDKRVTTLCQNISKRMHHVNRLNHLSTVYVYKKLNSLQRTYSCSLRSNRDDFVIFESCFVASGTEWFNMCTAW